MPNKTANYNLIKPLGSEHYDINIHNGNMDIIDEELKKVTESNDKRIDEIKSELKDSSLEIFKTDVLSIKLDECAGGFLNVQEIKGRTLVNLANFPKANYHDNLWEATNIIKYTTTGKNISVINNTGRLVRCDTTSEAVGFIRRIECPDGVTNIVLGTNESLHNTHGLPVDGWTDANKNDLLKVMILEGDYTNKPIPSYFEGIQSVGESTVVGSNLFNINNHEPFVNNDTIINNSTLRIYSNGVHTHGSVYKLNLVPNSLYKINFNLTLGGNATGCYIAIIDGKNNPIKNLDKEAVFVTPTDGKIGIEFTRLGGANDTNGWVDFTNITLKECQYKIEILSETENLLDINEKVETTPLIPIPEQYKCKAQDGKLYIYTGASNYHGYGFKRWLNKGDYYISSKNLTPAKSVYVILNSDTGVNIQIKNAEQSNLNVPCDGWYYVCFDIVGDSSLNDPVILTDIMLTKGTTKKDYTPYKGDKTEIILKEPLRQWDSIDSNGVVNRGSGQITLNGTENWWASSTGTYFKAVITIPNCVGSWLMNVEKSNSFKCDTLAVYDMTGEGFAIDGNGQLIFTIAKSKLTTPDVSGWKAWLASNPTTVVYQLATPTTETTNKTLDLKAYDNLIVDAGSIQPEVTYFYPKNTGERLVTIEDTVNSVKGTVEDINKNLDEKIREINVKTSNIKVPVTKVNGKDGEINLSANDIKNSEGKTIETKLNELFQSANSSLQSANRGKTAIAGAVGGVTGQNSFDEIANYIASKRNEIGGNLGAGDYATMQRLNDWTSQRKIDLANQLVSKGVLASASENLGALISKVANINTGLQYSTGSVIITVPADYSGGGSGSALVSSIPISVNSLNFKPKTVFYYVDGNSDTNNRLNVDYNSTATSGPKVSYAQWTGQFLDTNDSLAEKLRINYNDGFKAKFSDFVIQGDTSNAVFTNKGFSVDISFSDSRPHNGGKANVTWLAIG